MLTAPPIRAKFAIMKNKIEFIDIVTVGERAEDGSIFIPLTDKVLARLGLKEGNELDIEVVAGELVIRKSKEG